MWGCKSNVETKQLQFTYIPLLLPAFIIPEYSFCTWSLRSLRKMYQLFPVISLGNIFWFWGFYLEIPPVICMQVNAAWRKIAVGFWCTDIPG
jgi:hypothetical protein